MRKTKIVATIGPASDSLEMLKKLMMEGLNVARLNFSHGSHEEHSRRIALIRQAEDETGQNVALLLDTKGPEIRTGIIKEGSVLLKEGEQLLITSEEIEGDQHRVSVSYPYLAEEISVGTHILIDDGLIEVEVEKVEGNDIITRILNGGQLGSRKGVNIPGVSLNLPGITEKDAQDICFGLEQGIDFIAASFVRKAKDILEIRHILEKKGRSDVQIIAKIENREGIDNIDEILEVSDAVMVARGDLGVEVPAEEVPLMQKMLIKKCNEQAKPVITATQMLDSMQRNPRPTRAEVGDVANAILDGSDAVMLSGETAAGKYPLEALKTMARIAERTEKELNNRVFSKENAQLRQITSTDVISQAVSNAVLHLGASAILTPTESGYTAQMISKYKPNAPIIAVTPNKRVMRRLALVWGVYPIYAESADSTDEMLEVSVDAAVQAGLIKHGDLVVITAGVPVREPGTTNMLKIHVVGEIVGKGQGIGKKVISGKVIVANTAEEAQQKMTENAILVTLATDKEMVWAIEQASAVIAEEGGVTSHAAIVGLSLGKPVIVGVDGATTLFTDGEEITVDAIRGHIYVGHAKVL